MLYPTDDLQQLGVSFIYSYVSISRCISLLLSLVYGLSERVRSLSFQWVSFFLLYFVSASSSNSEN